MRVFRDYPLLGLKAMNEFRMHPGDTGLVVVDMQYASTHRDYGFQKLRREIGAEDEVRYYQDRLRDVAIPNIQRLLELFRSLDAEVVYLTVGSEREDYGDFCPRWRWRIDFWRRHGLDIPHARVGEEGHAILEELRPREGESVINKTTLSAFNSSSFARVLHEKKLSTLVFCGVSTAYCVDMTFRDASDRGFLCVLAEDGCAASCPEMHARALENMAFYGRVETTQSVASELLQGAP